VGERMSTRARRQRILELLAADDTGAIQVERLSVALGVSLATIRRDLSQLREDRHITRTYGGAVLGTPSVELPIHQRQMTRGREKDLIARNAARLVERGDVVLLDGGSTTERLAHHLRGVGGLTVFTNGLGAMNALVADGDVEVVVLGGRLRRINQSTTGTSAEQVVRGLHADVAFLGADAVHPRYGIASRTFEQSVLKTVMVQHAHRVVVVADSAKLHQGWSAFWSPLQRPWTLFTDDGVGPEALRELRRAAPHADVVVCRQDDPTNPTTPTEVERTHEAGSAARPHADAGRADRHPRAGAG
jgi:DeoR/GlpR family transcriptional regulator of sugar metabolism